MPKNIFVDLNVIIDVVLERPGYEASERALATGETDICRLYVSAHEITTLSYLLGRAKIPPQKQKDYIAELLAMYFIVPTNTALLQRALESHLADYEDAVVEQAALRAGCVAIITRNVRDFVGSAVPAFMPEDFLQSV